MTTICRAYTCHVIIRSVRIGWICCIVVFSYNVILILRLRHIETTLTVSHPNTEFITTQRAKHHTIVFWNSQTNKATLKLLTCVMAQMCAMRMFWVDQVEFYHKLTTIANTERKGVFTRIERI